MNQRASDTLKGLLALAALSCLPIAWVWIGDTLWGADPPYNAAVFPAFRQVEAYCRSLDFEDLTVRCESVNQFADACERSEDRCTADEAYDHYSKLMFNLPPLRIEKAN